MYCHQGGGKEQVMHIYSIKSNWALEQKREKKEGEITQRNFVQEKVKIFNCKLSIIINNKEREKGNNNITIQKGLEKERR